MTESGAALAVPAIVQADRDVGWIAIRGAAEHPSGTSTSKQASAVLRLESITVYERAARDDIVIQEFGGILA